MGDAVIEKEKSSLPSTHISSSISINDSFGTVTKSLEKSWYFSLFTKNSKERKNVMDLGKEAEKKYNDPDSKNNREYLRENIYEKAISNSDKYLSDHTAPKTMAGKKIWRQMLEARNAAKQEKAIVENSVIHENEGLTIKNVLFNSTQSYTVDDFKRFKKKQKAYEGYEGNHGDNIHRNAYLMLAKKDFESLSKSERVAMNAYTTNSRNINDALRKGEYESGKCDETLLNNITHMKHAFAKHNLPSDITTYRGVNDGMIKYWLGLKGIDKDQAGEFLNANGSINHDKFYQLKIYEKLNGITFQDKAFVSTTTNKPFAKRWTNELAYHKFDDYNDEVGSHIMVMNIPKGTRAMFSDTMYTQGNRPRGQDELTLDAGYTYTINGITPIKAGVYEFNIMVHGDTEMVNLDEKKSVAYGKSSESFIGEYSDLSSMLEIIIARIQSIFIEEKNVPETDKKRKIANSLINAIQKFNELLNGNGLDENGNPIWLTLSSYLSIINGYTKQLIALSDTQVGINLLNQCIKISDDDGVVARRISYYATKGKKLEKPQAEQNPQVEQDSQAKEKPKKVNDVFSPRKMYNTARNLELKQYNERYSDIVYSMLSEMSKKEKKEGQKITSGDVVSEYTGDTYVEYNAFKRGTLESTLKSELACYSLKGLNIRLQNEIGDDSLKELVSKLPQGVSELTLSKLNSMKGLQEDKKKKLETGLKIAQERVLNKLIAKYRDRSEKLSATISRFTTKTENVYYRGIKNRRDLKYMLPTEEGEKWEALIELISQVGNGLKQNVQSSTVNKSVDQFASIEEAAEWYSSHPDEPASLDSAGDKLTHKEKVKSNSKYDALCSFWQNQILTEKGFLSVSNYKKVALDFANHGNQGERVLLKITIPPGVFALPIMKHSNVSGEEELLLKDGTQFEVSSAHMSSDDNVLVLEVKVIASS